MSQLAASGRPIRSDRPVASHQPRSTGRPSSARSRMSSAGVGRRVEAVTGTRQGGTGFMILVGVIALLGVMALLMLNTMRAEQSFTVGRLQSDVMTLQQRQQQLQSDLSAVGSPENLAVKADSLGMVQASSVKYVRASDHKTLGVAKVNGAGQALNVETLPDTPANKIASQMLADGTIGAHITNPSAAAAQAKQKAAGTKTAGPNKAAKNSVAKH